MAKIAILLVLGICLALQLTAAFPHQKPSSADEKDNIRIKDLQIPYESKSDFRALLQPVIINILTAIQDYSNTLILETTTFLEDLLVELNGLPEQNEFVEELIPKLTQLLEHMEKLDLDDDTIAGLKQKETILKEIAKMYEDCADIAKKEDETSETAVLKNIFEKLDLDKLSDTLENSMKQAVQKYTEIFERFWNSLSEAQKAEHSDMSDWYERFQAKETAQEKYRTFIEFLEILKTTLAKEKKEN